MSKVVRSVKNVTKGYSTVQVKVRNGRLHWSLISAHDADSFCSHIKRSMGSDRDRYERDRSAHIQ
jgi:hypothetical protein